MLEICAIASGSNGNCYYIGNSKAAVLIDAGISCKQVLERMESKKLDPLLIKAVFISHEHTDHFSGARVLSKKLNIPVYITEKTWDNTRESQRPQLVKIFSPGDTVTIGGFLIHTFSKNHDAADPCSFRVEYDGACVGVFTDIGTPCGNVNSHFRLCHALFMETNYDEDMLWNGPYPYFLKARIASSHGHLSNKQAYELLKMHHHPELEMVFLSHLSAENNCPKKAASAFEHFREYFHVKLTDRYAPSEVYQLKLRMKS